MKKASLRSRRLSVATAVLLATALSLAACGEMRPVGDDGPLKTSTYKPAPFSAGRGGGGLGSSR